MDEEAFDDCLADADEKSSNDKEILDRNRGVLEICQNIEWSRSWDRTTTWRE